MVLTGRFLYICQLYMYIHLYIYTFKQKNTVTRYININVPGISVKKSLNKVCQSGLSVNVCTACAMTFLKKVWLSQGSILGPLLLLIYINNMQIAVKCNLFLYADDTCLVFQGKNVMAIKKQLNEDCQASCIIFVILQLYVLCME